MLSINLIKLANEDYYLDLLDYYLGQGKRPTWIGGLAEIFQLKGQTIEREHFKRLLRGQHPWANQTDSDDPDPPPAPLVQNAGLPNRQAAWDLTFSAPKSLSVIWASATPEMAKTIEGNQMLAVEKTFAFIEEHLAYCRVGKGGTEIVPAKIIAASIQDYLSRAGDPQLHVHNPTINLGYCPDGKFRSILSRPFFKNKIMLGAMERAWEAHLNYQAFGFQTKRVGNCYEIKGVPKDIIDFRSTRRKQLLAHMAKTGTSGAKAAEKAALATRSSKKNLPPLSVLKEKWPEEHERLFGFNAQAIEALRHGVKDTKHFIPEVLATAIKNMVANQHHFNAHDFLREALFEAAAYAVSPHDLFPAVQDFLSQSADIIPIPALYGEQRYTTTTILEQELALLNYARAMYATEGAVLKDKVVDKAIATAQEEAQAKGWSISDEQLSAIRHLTQDKHSIRILQGYAGVGKTTATLRPTVKAFQAAGYKVIGAAYTAGAARELSEATGVTCSTLHKLLGDYETKFIDSAKRFAKHNLRNLGRAAKKKKTYYYKGKPKPVKFDSKTVVLVDEAGMAGCRQTQLLLGRLVRAGATLLFTGDYAQIGAIEGTSPLFSLSQRMPHAVITDIKRQAEQWARDAAKEWANGNVAAALKFYDDRKLLHSSEDDELAMQALFDQWKRHSLHTPENSRIITCTNDQAHDLNLMAQQTRLAEAPASGLRSINRSLSIEDTDEDGTYTSQVYVGDRVLFKENNTRLGINNGDVGTVVAFDGGHIVVDLDHDERVSIPVMGKKAYKRVRLGYASTTNAVQGKTFPLVYTLLTGSMMDLPISYVQGTRSVKDTYFFTSKRYYDQLQELEESPLIAQLRRQPDRSLAADLFTTPHAADEDPLEVLEKVLEDWKDNQASGSTLIVTATQEEADYLNEQCYKIAMAKAQVDWEKKQSLEREESPAPTDQGKTSPLSDSIPTLNIHGKTLFTGQRVHYPKGSFFLDGTGILPGATGTITNIDLYHKRYEVLLDGRDEIKTIQADSSPETENYYALSYMLAKQARHRRDLEHAMLVNPQNFETGHQPTSRTTPDPAKQDTPKTGLQNNSDQNPFKHLDKVLQDWDPFQGTEPTLIVTSTEEEDEYLNDQCYKIAMARAAVDWDDKKKLAAKQHARSKEVVDLLPAGPLPTLSIRGKTLFLGQRVRFPDVPIKLDRATILSGDSGTITAINLDLHTYEVQIDGSEKTITIDVDDSIEIKNNYALWYMLANRIRHERELEHARNINSPRPSTAPAPDLFQWNPAQPPSPTLFTDYSQTGFSGLSSFSSANTHIYQQTDSMHQHAAAWHQQVQQANQTTHWSQQQAQYLQEFGHSHQQTTSTHEHRL